MKLVIHIAHLWFGLVGVIVFATPRLLVVSLREARAEWNAMIAHWCAVVRRRTEAATFDLWLRNYNPPMVSSMQDPHRHGADV